MSIFRLQVPFIDISSIPYHCLNVYWTICNPTVSVYNTPLKLTSPLTSSQVPSTYHNFYNPSTSSPHLTQGPFTSYKALISFTNPLYQSQASPTSHEFSIPFTSLFYPPQVSSTTNKFPILLTSLLRHLQVPYMPLKCTPPSRTNLQLPCHLSVLPSGVRLCAILPSAT